jgi:hypothetical protein
MAALLLFGMLPRPAAAQYATGYVPYFGKNKVHYDNFAWRIYKSPHFEVYYYPEFEQHLSRLTSYLESGYQKLSAGLKHEMPAPIPAILYKTHSEFEQTNLFPTFLPEGVLAFAEPTRGRLLLPIDEPPDKLNGLIQHELTHVFAFDMDPEALPTGHPSLDRRGVGRVLPGALGAARPDDDPRRRDHGPGAQALAGRVRGLLRPARLQHGPRLLRVHGGAVRQGGDSPVPLYPPEGHPRGNRG